MSNSDRNTQRHNSSSLKKKLIRVNVNSRWLPEDFFPRNISQSPSKNNNVKKLGQLQQLKSPESPKKRNLNRIRNQKQYLLKQQDLVKTSEGSIEKIVEREIGKCSNRYCRLQKQDSEKVELYLQMIKANLRNSYKQNDEFIAIVQRTPQYCKNIRQNHHINGEMIEKSTTDIFQQAHRNRLKSERQSREKIKNRSSSLIKMRRSLNTANTAGSNNPRRSSQIDLPCDTLKFKHRYSDRQDYQKSKKQQQDQRKSNPESYFDPSGIFTFYGTVNVTLESKATVSKGIINKDTLKPRLPKIK